MKKTPVKNTAKIAIYNPATIERKWQKKWVSSKLYKTQDKTTAAKNRSKTRDKSATQEKAYILDMFPYPSGEGLHVGHPKGYIATDVVSRMKRMQGMNVLHPMGFDAFGLPAENYAIKTKTNPMESVAKNVKRFKKQLEILGLDYDWSREINTTDPKYYKWTQWIFLQLWKKGLAYESYEPINWCPSCKTGLANEDVEDCRCERCNTLVEKKPMRQWVLKITDYADRLLADLDATEVYEFTNTKGSDAWVEGLPATERHVVYCILKHWSEDKFLCMKWKKNDWKGYIIGGIEPGETIEATAVRETREETGYQNVVFRRLLGHTRSRFYQEIKKQNRLAHGNIVYLELTDGQQLPITDDEKSIQDMEWVPREQVRDFVNREDLKYMWDLYTGDTKQTKLLDWPEPIKESQRNWIGRSEGALIKFGIKNSNIEVFTTRPDTLFGVTYVVLAPEHKLVSELLTQIQNRKEVEEYINRAKNETEMERTDATKEKTGVELKGISAINPANNTEIPVWVADYVLADYGTGAVMAVPAHDERDFAFASKFKLPIKKVIQSDKDLYTGYGNLENSGTWSGKRSEEIMSEITKSVGGSWVTKYKLRDWVFSRQRYWGEPIPLIHCDKCGVVAVPDKDLPVKLPKVKSYEPTGTGESPLAAIAKWVNVKCPQCRGKAKRETNTMPQWAGSSWYYLRYEDPKNKKSLVDLTKEKYWAPVDLYVGGAEHATRHLIYARFWHKFLYDIGVVSSIEPFKKLQNVGLIMGEDGRKMSKRFGNVVNPDDIVANYGADTLRIYEMFMGPFDQQIAWNTESMVGPRRFIERVWKMSEKVVTSKSFEGIIGAHEGGRDQAAGPAGPDSASRETLLVTTLTKTLHKAIKKVTEDILDLHFNTAISTLMITANEMEKHETISRESYEIFLKLLAPFAPHVTEELWTELGNKKSIHLSNWPKYDISLTVDSIVTIMLQVNGKVRGSLEINKDTSSSELENMAKNEPRIIKWLEGKPIKRVVVVPGKLVNIVV